MYSQLKIVTDSWMIYFRPGRIWEFTILWHGQDSFFGQKQSRTRVWSHRTAAEYLHKNHTVSKKQQYPRAARCVRLITLWASASCQTQSTFHWNHELHHQKSQRWSRLQIRSKIGSRFEETLPNIVCGWSSVSPLSFAALPQILCIALWTV